MSEMYTKHAKKYDSVARDNIYNALLERPSTMALLGEIKGKNILDMGCGSGIYAEWFLEQSANTIKCLDASVEMIELVKTKLGDNVEAYVQDVAHGLPKEANNSADIIVSPLVVHYIENLVPVFKDAFRVLKPGGCMVFSTHHPFADFECSLSGNYFEREHIQEEWNTVGTPVSVSFYRRSLTELCDAVTSSGFIISKISEGNVDARAKDMSESTYNQLKNKPNFIFIRCEKPI